MVNKVLEIDKEMYAPCVAYEKGGRVLNVELLRALYGTVKVNCLFWQCLEKYLMADWGFISNPYDECVANKTIDVGSPQVSFLMCTLEIPQKNCSTSSLLLTLFTFTFEPFLKL